MDLTTESVWKNFGSSLYLFILKRTHDVVLAQDVLQITFLKVHENLHKLKEPAKVKAWVFQIARNELANQYRRPHVIDSVDKLEKSIGLSPNNDFCCFDNFIKELPDSYRTVVELTYIKGKSNAEVAAGLKLTLPNVKARIRRAKEILKKRFQQCCQYSINESGKLVGEPDCAVCSSN